MQSLIKSFSKHLFVLNEGKAHTVNVNQLYGKVVENSFKRLRLYFITIIYYYDYILLFLAIRLTESLNLFFSSRKLEWSTIK